MQQFGLALDLALDLTPVGSAAEHTIGKCNSPMASRVCDVSIFCAANHPQEGDPPGRCLYKEIGLRRGKAA